MSGITSQRERRSDPCPWTWELPVGVALAYLVLAALAAHLARAVANLAAGGRWAFPPRADLFTSLPALVTGHSDAGLLDPSGALATAGAMFGWIVVAELLLLAGAVAALRVGLDRWGPGRTRGLATRRQAEQLLGRSRLRRHAAIIRPDLYPPRRRG